MKTTLQYISAKTLRMMDDGRVGLQGTGTIIQSHERYYLLTAYHCLGKVNEKGKSQYLLIGIKCQPRFLQMTLSWNYP